MMKEVITSGMKRSRKLVRIKIIQKVSELKIIKMVVPGQLCHYYIEEAFQILRVDTDFTRHDKLS